MLALIFTACALMSADEVVVSGPVELLADTRFALAPFDAAGARRLIDGLALRRLLDGVRGKAAADVDAVADALARFSVLCATLGEAIAEIDVNPVIAGPAGCRAVDALVVPRAGGDC